jgi:hypothetical protein
LEIDDFEAIYNEIGQVDQIVSRPSGASLVVDLDSKEIIRTNEVEEELFNEFLFWQEEHGKLDLSDRLVELQTLEPVKQAKIAEIVAEAAQRQEALVADYSSAERSSWDKKIEEAKTFLADHNLSDVTYLPIEAIDF